MNVTQRAALLLAIAALVASESMAPAAAAADASPQPDPATAPSAPTEAPSAAAAPAQAPPPSEAKLLAVSVDYEFHRFIHSPALAGTPTSAQALLLRAGVSFTRHDEIALAAGVLESYLADAAESGVRVGDLALRYTHRFELPASFQLAASVSATAPTSYWSQLASNITVPGASLALSREFGDLALSLSVLGRYYWNRYASESVPGASGTGMPNLSWSVGGVLSAAYAMPFLRALSLGARLVTVAYWYDSPGSQSPPSAIGMPGGTYGATAAPPAPDPHYGLDVHVTYAPKFDWLALSVTAGVGRTTTWLMRLDDVAQFYFFNADNFDAYAAIGVAY